MVSLKPSRTILGANTFRHYVLGEKQSLGINHYAADKKQQQKKPQKLPMAAEKRWVLLDVTESDGELVANQVYIGWK